MNKILPFLLIFIYIINNQTLYSFENSLIETEKIILRVIKIEDANDIFEFTSDPEVSKLTGMFKLHNNIDETKCFIEKAINSYKNKSSITWSIVNKCSNKIIGIFSLFNYTSTHFKAEIGFTLMRSYWNQGITTHATKAILNYCFNTLGLNRIQATFDPRNLASRRILEKAGFKYEGFLQSYYYLNNEFCDRFIYSILKRSI